MAKNSKPSKTEKKLIEKTIKKMDKQVPSGLIELKKWEFYLVEEFGHLVPNNQFFAMHYKRCEINFIL